MLVLGLLVAVWLRALNFLSTMPENIGLNAIGLPGLGHNSVLTGLIVTHTEAQRRNSNRKHLPSSKSYKTSLLQNNSEAK